MNPREVKSIADAIAIVTDNSNDYVKVGVFDLDGVLRAKYLARDKFLNALENGLMFCDIILGWDCNDQAYDRQSYTGWETGFSDVSLSILPETCRSLPFENGVLFFLSEFQGRAESYCPRGILRRILSRAEKMGYSALAACEFEFFMFDESPKSIREKHYYDLNSVTPGNFGYSMLRSSVYGEFQQILRDTCQDMDIKLESLHPETGPGVLEAAIGYDYALNAADKGALFKTVTKILAQQQGQMATFMAKWSQEWPGQSGHIHMSLRNTIGECVFHDSNNEYGMSNIMRWFVGGQQALMPELLAMVAGTINSYRRLVPGLWAPTTASWGIENRTCALRAIPSSPQSQRVEYRIAAADINPYIAIAAALGSGLWGIEHQIEPTEAIQGNAYERTLPECLQLPATLEQATRRLRDSEPARQLFGDEFVDHYAYTREWENSEFQKAVTDWELQRYFEII